MKPPKNLFSPNAFYKINMRASNQSTLAQLTSAAARAREAFEWKNAIDSYTRALAIPDLDPETEYRLRTERFECRRFSLEIRKELYEEDLARRLALAEQHAWFARAFRVQQDWVYVLVVILSEYKEAFRRIRLMLGLARREKNPIWEAEALLEFANFYERG